ncbi:MAG: glycosyltransferase family 1 protein, partial [Methanomicrobiales archaeon]|nr:glycosyltransferase family 1 protein [Methanomicrobiales archaeon]
LYFAGHDDIGRHLSDRGALQERALRARASTERFDITAIGDRHVALYRSLTG